MKCKKYRQILSENSENQIDKVQTIKQTIKQLNKVQTIRQSSNN